MIQLINRILSMLSNNLLNWRCTSQKYPPCLKCSVYINICGDKGPVPTCCSCSWWVRGCVAIKGSKTKHGSLRLDQTSRCLSHILRFGADVPGPQRMTLPVIWYCPEFSTSITSIWHLVQVIRSGFIPITLIIPFHSAASCPVLRLNTECWCA